MNKNHSMGMHMGGPEGRQIQTYMLSPKLLTKVKPEYTALNKLRRLKKLAEKIRK